MAEVRQYAFRDLVDRNRTQEVFVKAFPSFKDKCKWPQTHLIYFSPSSHLLVLAPRLPRSFHFSLYDFPIETFPKLRQTAFTLGD